ncbi:DUF1508 domain-containing protein [Sulfidibacter corallicola]|uniref:DUF1508 domain-containing protein n=1 Tax=Sulfidibacter corallicola TaxID=2818388 RepID=A0A8A4TFG0_SULCO|nr:DUF1508 domain-containing protein [Sulfidibacter corallicola]
MADKWEIYQDRAGEWRWCWTSPNGNIVGATSVGHSSKRSCIENARRHGYVRASGKGAKDRWAFYKDRSGKWHWRRIAPNEEVVGKATEGCSNKSDCESNTIRNGYDK